MNGTLSFAQVDEMSDAFAVYLREVAGLVEGDRVNFRQFIRTLARFRPIKKNKPCALTSREDKLRFAFGE